MRSIVRAAAFAGISLLAMSASAQAQSADDKDEDDIVVTGTLIRGIAPAGTSVVDVSPADIEASSATTVTELLTDVPQFGSFNDLQTLSGGGNFVTTNRPNLRNLPGFTTTGTSTTLLLIDGNRVVGMGISSTTPDADFVPPGIIERVEIVPDGGSALYGSDAVAGVVNFITRKRFDGVKVDARYGFGKQYHTIDGNVTIGKQWDTGSVWASYNYAENSQIFGRDRDYNFTPLSLVSGLQIRDLECSSPNLSVAASPGGATALYGSLSAAARNTANICDLTDETGMYPEQKRHSIYVGFNQELSDAVEFDVKAFYYRKEQEFSLGQYSGAVNLGPSFLAAFGFITSPFNVSLTGSPVETKAINFALGPNYLSTQQMQIDAWGIRPTLTAKLGGDWQLRGTLGYSESKSESHTSRLDLNGGVRAAVISGAFNPFLPLTASAATVAAMTNWETYGKTDQAQLDIKLVADGSLFDLPGGAVKAAVGVEYIREDYNTRKGDVIPANFASLPRRVQSRNVKSAFGEIIAPLFGGNGGPSLTVSASGRYDEYNDVGDTFNPKFGATFKPVEWLSLRGAWGKSFVAPSLADSFIADPTALNWIDGATLNFIAPPGVLAANGFPAVGPGQKVMFLLGSSPGLQPQKAKTWSLGFDMQPPFIPGLRLSGSYYNIEYTNIISLVPFINQQQFFSVYAGAPGSRTGAFFLSPTQAEVNNILGQAVTTVGAACAPQPTCVYGIQDVRKRNLGGFKQDGIDFTVDYRTETGFGGIDFNFGGTHILNQKNQRAAGLAYLNDTNYSNLKLRTSLGADVGQFRAQATWNFNKGYDLVVPVGLNNQTKVGNFSTIDLFLKYDFGDEGVLADTALTVTVNNLFDKYPPVYTGGDIVRAQRGFRNGNTLGRLVQVGFSKQF